MNIMTQTYHQRSLFWPLILIGVGAIWLLSNAGILQPASIGMLFRLWPVILIIIGLDLLFGRNNPTLGTIIGLGGVALIVVLMLVGPGLGLVKNVEVQQAAYTEPVGDASSASVSLSVGVAQTHITALNDSSDLFDADLRYVGEVEYKVTGTSEKYITLTQKGSTSTSEFFGWFDGPQNLRWDIGLNPNIPLTLNVNAGVSDTTLDLQDLQIADLRVSGGVGNLTVNVPNMDYPYHVNVSGGVGDFRISIEEGAALTIDVSGGVGEVNIDVPDGAAVKVDGSTGVGSISVPSDYQRVSGNDEAIGDSGVWQSPNFEESSRQIVIHFDGGVGGFTVR